MPKDNRKILSNVRGLGVIFRDGLEDELAAELSQTRLDDLVAEGVLEGNWESTRSRSVLQISGDAPSKELAKRIAEEGLEIAGQNNFEPLSIEETVAAMKKYDFSEQVTRSMTFHGSALRDALRNAPNGGKLAPKADGKPKDGATDEADDFPEGFPAFGKIALKKLGKTFADIKELTREQLIELDNIAEKSADDILAFIAPIK